MKVTRRRHNLAEAYKLLQMRWVTIAELQEAGAYGTRLSIRVALVKMMQHGAVRRKPMKPPQHFYQITHKGMLLCGMVPEKLPYNRKR